MKFIYLWIFVLAVLSAGCSKKDFLDEKPNQSHVVPTTLSELQAILDNDVDLNGMGTAGRGPVPNLGEVGSDNFFVPDDYYNSNLSSQSQKYYRWEQDIFDGSTEVFSWKWPYKVIFNTNVVLDGLNKIKKTDGNKEAFEYAKGIALFSRAHAFYQLAQIFAPPYDEVTAHIDKGIPLRLSSDLNEKLIRNTVEETYNRIFEDLYEAKALLSIIPKLKTHPSKQAAYGLISRIHLSMRQYDKAFLYADSCIQLQSELLNYNDLDVDSKYPLADIGHKEVLFLCNMIEPYMHPLSAYHARVSNDLFNMYHVNDLRRSVFFEKESIGFRFRGSYSPRSVIFAGIALDEIYLIRAECSARKGNVLDAMQDLNYLMKNRWHENSEFKPYAASDSEEALSVILIERRKELVFRGLRWSDLRRLNLEGRNIILERVVNNVRYRLTPNDPRYIFPLPLEVLTYYSQP